MSDPQTWRELLGQIIENPREVKVMSDPQTWRELLGQIIENPREKQRLAGELGIRPITLTRWAHEKLRPRLSNLLLLVKALPKHRKQLIDLIPKEFPEFTAMALVVEDSPKDRDRMGQQFGNYRLISFMGQGGFADVYLGEHVYFKAQAAIKVLREWERDPDTSKERLLNETRIIAHLKHPNIIQVLEFGIEGSTPFLVLNYAPNGTLRQRYPKGTPLPLTTIVPYVKQIAAALQYIHNNKLIYRAIKPENILLGENNEVWLCDFGETIMAPGSPDEETDVIGTAPYMAPEQIRGKSCFASDQYALGIVVYEWLCGDPPFQGSFTEVVAQHLAFPPPPLREKVPTIPPLVEQVVLTALAKDPQKRFASVQAFANAFEQACLPPQLQRLTPVVPHIFVSHSSKDNDFGLKLVQDLRKALGHDDAIWYDTAGGLYGGDAWWDRIKEELKARSIFIVVLSPDAMTSAWVQDEIRIAWRLKNSPAKKRIIPILHRECEVPEDLDTLQIISFLHPTPYESALNELLVALGLLTNNG